MYLCCILVARVFLKNRDIRLTSIIKFSCFFVMQRTVRGPRADITCLCSSIDYVRRSSILVVFLTMSSSPNISPKKITFVSFAFEAFVVKSQNGLFPLNPRIFNNIFRKETPDYLFRRLKTSSSKKSRSVILGKISPGAVNTCFIVPTSLSLCVHLTRAPLGVFFRPFLRVYKNRCPGLIFLCFNKFLCME